MTRPATKYYYKVLKTFYISSHNQLSLTTDIADAFGKINTDDQLSIVKVLSTIQSFDPLAALLEGQRLVSCSRMLDGIAHVQHALSIFSSTVNGSNTDVPTIYLFIDDCYLSIMSASFGIHPQINYRATYDRQKFREAVNFDERTQDAQYPCGYVLMNKSSLPKRK